MFFIAQLQLMWQLVSVFLLLQGVTYVVLDRLYRLMKIDGLFEAAKSDENLIFFK